MNATHPPILALFLFALALGVPVVAVYLLLGFVPALGFCAGVWFALHRINHR